MYHKQLDLFSDFAQEQEPVAISSSVIKDLSSDAISDKELIEHINVAMRRVDVVALVVEVGRWKLEEAVPLLEKICRRFAGYGIDQVVAEQVAVLEALSDIGGEWAAKIVKNVIIRREVIVGQIWPMLLLQRLNLGFYCLFRSLLAF